jgi:HEAT repeat protein
VAFAQLVEALTDKDFGVRTSAAAALVRVGAEAVPHLEKLLEDPKMLVRVNAACNLLKIQSHAAAVEVIKDALRADQDDKVKRNAFYDLSNMGPAAIKALPAILHVLDDPSHAVRERAFDVLQILGPLASPAVPKLLELWKLKQDKSEVIFTLGCMGPAAAKAVPQLIEALSEKAMPLVARAATALGDIGPVARPAVPALVKALNKGKGEVPGRAAESLAKLGPPVSGAGPGLVKLLKHKTLGVRLIAARTLALLEPAKAKKALPVLAKDYKKHEFDRDEIAEVARMIDPKAAAKRGLV